MKLIFSRKGFDSGSGGCPSPIIDGKPLSLPIPSSVETTRKYGTLNGCYGDIVCNLTGNTETHDSYCHLDPDINPDAIPRTAEWRGCFGQEGSAQGHLNNQGIEPGDLFIFWGLYQNVKFEEGKWKFVGNREHRIYGYLQIGEIIRIGKDGAKAHKEMPAIKSKPWLTEHPHLEDGRDSNNTIYVASAELVVNNKKTGAKGSGVLTNGIRLTAPESYAPSFWKAPVWLNPKQGGCGFSYHGNLDRWRENDIVKIVNRGQEFVTPNMQNDEIAKWVRQLVLM